MVVGAEFLQASRSHLWAISCYYDWMRVANLNVAKEGAGRAMHCIRWQLGQILYPIGCSVILTYRYGPDILPLVSMIRRKTTAYSLLIFLLTPDSTIYYLAIKKW